MKKTSYTLFILGLLAVNVAYAQFKIDGQILQRTELRNGYGGLIEQSKDPALFSAHRARMQAVYEIEKFSFYMSIQDIRVWGSTPQIKSTDNFLSVHEAWGQFQIKDNWFLKLGRQELNYDNARFLGNLDWALQGRAHDFALVKHEKENMRLHFGGAYNQNNQSLTQQPYTIDNQYKAAQMVRYENKWGKISFSTLLWNDGREWQKINNGAIIDKGIWYRTTLGIPTFKYNSGNSQFSAYYYYQFGKDISGKKVNAFNISGAYQQIVPIDKEAGKIWTFSVGTELISGSPSQGEPINRSFTPLYGTNHAFNGYMDLFYVGGSHENSVGLEDYFLRSRYAFNKNAFLQIDYHYFNAHSEIYQLPNLKPIDSHLGSEIDLTFGYILNEAVSIQAGYSHYIQSDSFEILHSPKNIKTSQNWAYLMFVFRPTIKNKFIGILL